MISFYVMHVMALRQLEKSMKKIFPQKVGEIDVPDRASNGPNQGVGRINPLMEALGACTSCHPRHSFQ